MEFENSTNDNIDLWEWQGEDYCLQQDSEFGFRNSLWDEARQNPDELLDVLGEQTPIKDCADLGYNAWDVGDYTKNGSERGRDSSRRMLQFTPDADNSSMGHEQITSFLNPTVAKDSLIGDGFLKNLQWPSHCDSVFLDEGLDPPFEGWLASDKMNDYATLDNQIDISEFYSIPSEMETDAVQEIPIPTCRIIKGRKSYIETSTKLNTSVSYPFTIIKPCGVQGDMTLKDINQRILAPPPRSKIKKDENPYVSYPTSSFSGKPVVVKTKIRTEGGKGSITIMRTKG